MLALTFFLSRNPWRHRQSATGATESLGRCGVSAGSDGAGSGRPTGPALRRSTLSGGISTRVRVCAALQRLDEQFRGRAVELAEAWRMAARSGAK
uniref:hypothetical protein n=1 Tax=Streptomyces sp. NBC_01001 TaxID=2903713 RepID=UPI002F911585